MSTEPDVIPLPRSCAGLIIHAPTAIESRLKGTYESTLPDGQKEIVAWDDGLKKTQYYDGTFPGRCDTVLSANLLLLTTGLHVDWDLHDLSEAGNDIGHLQGQDNLGMPQCSARIYSLLVRNTPGSVGSLVLGNASSDRWSGFFLAGATMTLPPSSVFAMICENTQGMPVGAGNSNLKVLASGGAATYGLNWNGCSV